MTANAAQFQDSPVCAGYYTAERRGRFVSRTDRESGLERHVRSVERSMRSSRRRTVQLSQANDTTLYVIPNLEKRSDCFG